MSYVVVNCSFSVGHDDDESRNCKESYRSNTTYEHNKTYDYTNDNPQTTITMCTTKIKRHKILRIEIERKTTNKYASLFGKKEP